MGPTWPESAIQKSIMFLMPLGIDVFLIVVVKDLGGFGGASWPQKSTQDRSDWPGVVWRAVVSLRGEAWRDMV